MSTHVNIESTYVKNYGPSIFSFPIIDTCYIFGLKHVNLTVWPKKVNEAKGLIFGINNHIYVIIYAKNQSHSFINFFWPNGQIYMF